MVVGVEVFFAGRMAPIGVDYRRCGIVLLIDQGIGPRRPTKNEAKMKLETVSELPALQRGGNREQSEETKQIIEALRTFQPHKLDGIEAGNVFNAQQQRIRQAATKAGLGVKIRYIESEKALYFLGFDKEAVVAEETPEVEVKTSTNTTK